MSSGNSFSDVGVWSYTLLIAMVLGSLLVANMVKRLVKPLRKSLIPVSVLAGILLLIASTLCKAISGEYLFNMPVFCSGSSRTGIESLEVLTYHCLAVGFIAMTLRKSKDKGGKGRTRDVFNTGLLTVNTYLMQSVLGLVITCIAAIALPALLRASGILLAFGYGQGTGQALNYGSIYEGYGFIGGKSFGLTVAALGFLSASFGGVIYLNSKRRKGTLKIRTQKSALNKDVVEDEGEIPMVESIDKFSIQIALVGISYLLCFLVMKILGNLVGEGLKSTIYGFNFLFGALMGVVVKAVISFLMKKNIIHRDYINNFLLNRIGGFAFDIMIVAGIGAIQLDLIQNYWFVLLLMGIVGAVSTYFYVHAVSYKLFPDYADEEFMVMFGTLTGTASTGVILLREIDPEFETPASENLVYQNFPAIVFGFPLMLIASFAPKSNTNTYIALGILVFAFIVLNILLFRRQLFGKKKAGSAESANGEETAPPKE